MQCQKSSGWGWAATPWPPSEIWSEALSGRPPHPTPCLPPWSTQTGFSDSTAAANKGSRRLIQLSSWREVLERGRKVKGLAVTQLVALPSLNDWYYTQTETGNSLQLRKCEIEATEYDDWHDFYISAMLLVSEFWKPELKILMRFFFFFFFFFGVCLLLSFSFSMLAG